MNSLIKVFMLKLNKSFQNKRKILFSGKFLQKIINFNKTENNRI